MKVLDSVRVLEIGGLGPGPTHDPRSDTASVLEKLRERRAQEAWRSAR